MAYEPAATLIATFDADGDARVTRAELDAGVRRSFGTIDTVKTGSLGFIAFADWAERFLGDRNALPSPFETDRDGDDRVSLAELQAKLTEFFNRYDRDKDGVVTRAELLTIRARAYAEDPAPGAKGKSKRR
jgi:Ca2+-binding EF-hand superfamily protein